MNCLCVERERGKTVSLYVHKQLKTTSKEQKMMRSFEAGPIQSVSARPLVGLSVKEKSFFSSLNFGFFSLTFKTGRSVFSNSQNQSHDLLSGFESGFTIFLLCLF